MPHLLDDEVDQRSAEEERAAAARTASKLEVEAEAVRQRRCGA